MKIKNLTSKTKCPNQRDDALFPSLSFKIIKVCASEDMRWTSLHYVEYINLVTHIQMNHPPNFRGWAVTDPLRFNCPVNKQQGRWFTHAAQSARCSRLPHAVLSDNNVECFIFFSLSTGLLSVTPTIQGPLEREGGWGGANDAPCSRKITYLWSV